MARCLILALLSMWFSATVGCATKADGPTLLQISADHYQFAFDAALTTSQSHGFNAQLRDRRQGIIETHPAISPSAYEPWRTGVYTAEQIIENTTSLQRRRVRWEFSARDLPAEDMQDSGREDILNLHPQTVDLTMTDIPIDIRVAVFIDRAYNPGVRPRIWTTSNTTTAIVIDPQTGLPVEKKFWTPVARDKHYEHLLLNEVQALLNDHSPDTSAEVAAIEP